MTIYRNNYVIAWMPNAVDVVTRMMHSLKIYHRLLCPKKESKKKERNTYQHLKIKRFKSMR